MLTRLAHIFTKKTVSKEYNLEKSCVSPVFDPSMIITYACDDFVFDGSGRKYLDFTSGIAVNAFGHSKHIVQSSILSQSNKVMHVSNLFITKPQLTLYEKLTKLANHSIDGATYTSTFLSNSGTEANEAALKFARMYAKKKFPSQTNKTEIIAFNNSFHGRTMGALSVTGQSKYQDPFGPLLPHIKFVDYNNLSQLKSAINANTCAVIIEPIQGEGGLQFMSKDFAHTLSELAQIFNVIVIVDEVQSGLFRTGTLFASERYELIPDIITLAKSLGGGLPLGATIISEQIHKKLEVGAHGTTMGGNPVACAASLAMLKKLLSPITRLQQKNSQITLHEEIKKINNQFLGCIPLGIGHLRGIALPDDIAASTVIDKAKDKNLLILKSGYNSIRIAPSLICPPKLIKKGMKIISDILHTLFQNSKSSHI